MKKESWSWGGIPKASHQVVNLRWRTDTIDFAGFAASCLPYGLGRSYGDVPINDEGVLVRTTALDRVIAFDPETGVLHCEAGISLGDILRVVVPRGWFLPVTPGTQFVTLGGAIANDVHGKNHHCAGTFGCHVLGFELLRSSGEKLWCTPTEHADYFAATVAGLGLTGLILTAKIQLTKIAANKIDVNNQAFNGLDEGLDLFEQHEDTTYTVAWVDCLTRGAQLGRGIFSGGEFSQTESRKNLATKRLAVPLDFPSFSLNKYSVQAFNNLYFANGKRKSGRGVTDYEPFFYPLDKVHAWNRIYGRKGFYQYQCCVPFGEANEGREAIREMLNQISLSGNASFLAVLKVFGDKQSPGMLSFPEKGITLALDFPNWGDKTQRLFDRLDAIVRELHGKNYPAKDACMKAADFQRQYPQWQEFASFIDPKFSSSFWRRVTQENA
ncbi:FAD-binding oxidoreductase [Teredinibacter turnerae]|uniref:FAD-binding oxidoreductase n=1 Tax=Teredinibacter turnerae TaxID=2426 RepID=UPI00037C82D4|nr:FAD-binding oxidoreductase [Teredinibacter turnerae]